MADAKRDPSAQVPFPAAVPVAGLGLDDSELGLLSVLRHLWVTQTSPGAQAWAFALSIAVERWGAERGAKILSAAWAFAEALGKARPTALRYADPLDTVARSHVSPDEVQLLRMLQAMRRDITPEARLQMARLTGGRIDPALVRTGLTLAQALPKPTSGGVMSRPGPALRLVH